MRRESFLAKVINAVASALASGGPSAYVRAQQPSVPVFDPAAFNYGRGKDRHRAHCVNSGVPAARRAARRRRTIAKRARGLRQRERSAP